MSERILKKIYIISIYKEPANEQRAKRIGANYEIN